MSRSTLPIPDPLKSLRQPEYTGENRCTPCTVVNVVIAGILGAGVATLSLPLGVVTVVASLGIIRLRGYLVPYTPALTKRYFPDRVLRWFDKTPAHRHTHSLDDYEEIDVSATLAEMGVIAECDDRDDLCLDRAFRELWRDEIETVRDRDRNSRDEAVVDLLGLEGDHEVEEVGNAATLVRIDGRNAGQWESEAALVADIAADRALRRWIDDWESYHVLNRCELMNTLRMFIERCPSCDTPVSLGQERVESCCRSYDVAALACEECESRLFEIKIPEDVRAVA